jgi:hypothetical protein
MLCEGAETTEISVPLGILPDFDASGIIRKIRVHDPALQPQTIKQASGGHGREGRVSDMEVSGCK